jgi:hypothetical protein
MSSVDPDLRRQQGIDYGEDGLVQLDWSYLSGTALYRKDMMQQENHFTCVTLQTCSRAIRT